MFCVVNIHWDGGWIDSSVEERFPETFRTFSAEAERKLGSYWRQIATRLGDRGPRLLFEGFNEETNFSNEGSEAAAYAALTRANHVFVDAVRSTGGHNAQRVLIVPGYHTDFEKTANPLYRLPEDRAADRLMISVHYYTPWVFCGLEEDADWGKVRHTWGSDEDVAELNRLFDLMADFSRRHDVPVFLGEFCVTQSRDRKFRTLWTLSVFRAALERSMVPVLWDIGDEVSRHPPYSPSSALRGWLRELGVE